MPTVFTHILTGDIPGTFVHRDERCAVIMSINPLARGHALVIPADDVGNKSVSVLSVQALTKALV